MLNMLKEKIAEELGWNKSRIDFISKFIIALFVSKTVNLAEIASNFVGMAKVESNYKRLQRFFRDYSYNHLEIVQLLMSFFQFKSQKFVLAMDRTNWKYGKSNINILTLAIIYKDIAIPIFWMLLDKRGNSNTDERKKIINDFISFFGVDKIDYLLADREFIGEEWFDFLIQNKISFVIRIKDNILIPNSRGEKRNAKLFFLGLKDKQCIVLPKRRKIWNQNLYVSGSRLSKNGLLIVLTDKEPENAVSNYEKRWNIETLFGFLKSKGFCMEDTHLVALERISKLFSLLAISFCWAYSTGEILAKQNSIKIKSHGRKAVSVFKLGFRLIKRVFCNLNYLENETKIVFKALFQFKESKIVLY